MADNNAVPTYTTDNKAGGNQIALAEAFLPVLDEVYRRSSRSVFLDTAPSRVRFDGANAVSIFKTEMSGLGNYDRNKGFLTGDVTGTWEKKTLSQDRGRGFLVDAMDNEETVGMAFGNLAGEFLRTQVVPEIDAYTFAKLASTSGILSGTAADLTASSDVPALISEAEYQMAEAEAGGEGTILFLSEDCYRRLKDGIVRTVENDERGVDHAVEYYDGMRVVRVPSARFHTAITLRDGITDGEGGFVPASGSYKINFLMVDPTSVIKVTRHAMPRIFAPGVTQSADAWLFQYRIYHDVFTLDNRVEGIYLHRGATALA
ncbi:MAG: hypothetical protein J5849_07705 [Clostridia bacterium]|nr:hypothetical protein [Clostridia bacterium]MBR5742511.1 hypothetical protein [Clostridia bacterium]